MNSSFFEALKYRRSFFQTNFPAIGIGIQTVNPKVDEKLMNSCPVCGYMTLRERASWDICSICFWEDDGSDDFCAEVHSGPNHMTLTEGRQQFEEVWNVFVNEKRNSSDLIHLLRKKFLELDNLINANRVNDKQTITALQKEIITVLKKNEVHCLEKLFKEKDHQ